MRCVGPVEKKKKKTGYQYRLSGNIARYQMSEPRYVKKRDGGRTKGEREEKK